MKFILKNYLYLGLVLILSGVSVLNASDYTRVESYNTTYIGYVAQSNPKSSRLIGAFKLQDGTLVDKEISTGFALTVKSGQQHTIEMNQMWYKQTAWNNLLFFFLPVLALSLGCTVLLRGWLRLLM